MQKNGIESPDRADALFGAMSAVDHGMFSPKKSLFDAVNEHEDRNVFNGISVGL